MTIASIIIGIMITVTSGIAKWMQELVARVLKHEKRRKSDAIKLLIDEEWGIRAMNDEEAIRATAELVTKILIECKKYADRDGLDFGFVVRTTAEAMLEAIKS